MLKKVKNVFLVIALVFGVFFVGIMTGGAGIFRFQLSNRLSRRRNEIDALLQEEERLKEKKDAAGVIDGNLDKRVAEIKRRKAELKKELAGAKRDVEGLSDEDLLDSVNDMLAKL